MKILIIIPTYNEIENIVKIINVVLDLKVNADVLIVDDNSPDGTSEAVKKAFSGHSGVFLITRTKKDGRGGAVMEGIKFAIEKDTYDKIIEMDADFSHDPKDLSAILEKSEDVDIVIGSRYLKKSKIIGWPLGRRLFSKIANLYAKILLKIPISDYTNGYRCYSIKAAKNINFHTVKAKGYIVLSEIAYQLFKKGFSFGEVSTIFVNRKKGNSNFDVNEVLNAFKGVWSLRFRNV